MIIHHYLSWLSCFNSVFPAVNRRHSQLQWRAALSGPQRAETTEDTQWLACLGQRVMMRFLGMQATCHNSWYLDDLWQISRGCSVIVILVLVLVLYCCCCCCCCCGCCCCGCRRRRRRRRRLSFVVVVVVSHWIACYKRHWPASSSNWYLVVYTVNDYCSWLVCQPGSNMFPHRIFGSGNEMAAQWHWRVHGWVITMC